MIKIKLSEETRYGLFFLVGLLALLLGMILLNYLFGRSASNPVAEKDKEKTVIVTHAKQDNEPKIPPAKSVVSTVRDAIKQGNYSTAYLEINNVPKNSPEYEELKKLVAEETRKRKAPGVRKDTGASPSAQVRYFDESTPRNRTTDAVYVYFVDVSGTLWPRFCIQVASKRPVGITGFTITADNKAMQIPASSMKFENTEKGVAEWYDVPLDRNAYEAVQAMLKAKKSTLTVIGSKGKATRDVTESEKKGFRQILEGYAALGGNLNYLQVSVPLPGAQKKH